MDFANQILELSKKISKDELLELIYSTFESEIIPKIISKIQLPELYDARSRRAFGFRAQRTRKRYQERLIRQDPALKNKIISEFQNLKQLFASDRQYYNEFNDIYSTKKDLDILTNIFSAITDVSSASPSLEYPREMLDGIPFLENYPEEVIKKSKTLIDSILEPEVSRLKLEFETQLKNKINSDLFFSKFIQESEIGLREFTEENNISLTCNFRIERDFEIPSWEKIILYINFLDNKITFNEKIALWDAIDDVIRDRIKNLIANKKESEKKLILNLNKIFFIEVNSF